MKRFIYILLIVVAIAALMAIPRSAPSRPDTRRASPTKRSTPSVPGDYGDIVYSRSKGKRAINIILYRRAARPVRSGRVINTGRDIKIPGLTCRPPCKRVRVTCSMERCGKGSDGCMAGESCNLFLPPETCAALGIRSGDPYPVPPISDPPVAQSQAASCIMAHELQHARQNSCKMSPCKMEQEAYETDAKCNDDFINKNCQDKGSDACSDAQADRCISLGKAAFHQCRVDGKYCSRCTECEDAMERAEEECGAASNAGERRQISCLYCLDPSDPLCRPTPTPPPTATPIASPTPQPSATPAPTSTPEPSPTVGPTATATATPGPHEINFCAGEGVSCGASFDAAAHRACACYQAYPSCYVGGVTQLTCFCGNSASDSLTDDIATMTNCAATQNGTLPPDFENKAYTGSWRCNERIQERNYSGQICFY